jgi:hypothetical protein
MIAKPAWLPEMFAVSPWTTTTFDDLYAIFNRDFIESQPLFQGSKIWFFPEKANGKELIFWHITERDDENGAPGTRNADFRRCERLPWARPMLDNHTDHPALLVWDFEEGDGAIKTYVWLQNFDYVVIMKKYDDGRRRLVTAFWLEYSSKKRNLQKKYDNRLQ